MAEKIVITGGPCGGKSAAVSIVKKELENLGFTVFVIAETATELINGGIAPWTLKTNLEFQKCQMKLQIEKEKVYETAAEKTDADKIVIICDRGTLDNKAYMTDDEFAVILHKYGLKEAVLRNSYSAVFHLETAAKVKGDFYSTKNNTARTETKEQAIELDNRIISAWTGHPHLRIIKSDSEFDVKMGRLIKEILFFLGIPEPLEIERKFLIDFPDLNKLSQNPFCKSIEIKQSYIKDSDGEKLRIRQCIEDGCSFYYETKKKNIDDIKRVEIERELSEEEYFKIYNEAGQNKKEIQKTRYRMVYGDKYFEIDVFPFWNDKALLEIELCDESESFVLPPEFKVVKEVTTDKNYRNSHLAKKYDNMKKNT